MKLPWRTARPQALRVIGDAPADDQWHKRPLGTMCGAVAKAPVNQMGWVNFTCMRSADHDGPHYDSIDRHLWVAI